MFIRLQASSIINSRLEAKHRDYVLKNNNNYSYLNIVIIEINIRKQKVQDSANWIAKKINHIVPSDQISQTVIFRVVIKQKSQRKSSERRDNVIYNDMWSSGPKQYALS